MNELETQLLREEVGTTDPRLVVRTGTRVDTGRWWQRSPLWLCVMEDELLMLAVARRRYLARLSLGSRPGTHYCHTTGELVIEPGEDLTYNRFRITPRQALAVLTVMGIAPVEKEIIEDCPTIYDFVD